jgi:tetratricopeptide (TPR) repeat protein
MTPQEFLSTIAPLMQSLEFKKVLQNIGQYLSRHPKFAQSCPSDADVLRIKCIAFEILDYLGRHDEALKAIIAESAMCRRRLSQWDREVPLVPGQKMSGEDHKLLKQQIWLVMHWALSDYRKHSYVVAEERLNLCRRVVRKYIEPHGAATRARLAYYLGLVYRQTYRYQPARIEFGQSIAHMWSWLEGHQDQRSELARFHVAKALSLGISYVHYLEGAHHLARPLLVTAKLLLGNSEKEGLIGHYINVVYASVQRAAMADSRRELLKAIKIFKRAHEFFTRKQHLSYKVKAAFELSLAYLRYAQFHGARSTDGLATAARYAKEVAEYPYTDVEWQCRANILFSRIHRAAGKFRLAFSYADKTIKAAGVKKSGDKSAMSVRVPPLIKVDASIAYAEVLIERSPTEQGFSESDLTKQYRAAAWYLETALNVGRNNPLINAVANLHLARVFILRGDANQANRHYNSALESMRKIENAFAEKLARSVGQKLEGIAGDFSVLASRDRIDHLAEEKKLRGWLTDWARIRCQGNDSSAATLLGISKPVFYKWREEAGKERQRHRPLHATRGTPPAKTN